MLFKKKLILSGIVILGSIAAIAAFQYWRASRIFLYAGTLETTKVILSSKVASDIIDFPISEGDAVTKGQLLLELSCDVYKVQAPQINNDYERAQALIQKGHMSQAQYDVLERNKQDNDLKLNWCRVTAPINGVVVTKFREQGEVVSVGTSLLSVADPYDIWAYFYVPHDMLYRLKIGQRITGILPEAPDKTFSGRIVKVNEEAEFTPKNVQTRAERTRLVYGVKVRFDNPDLMLKAGMTIESTLINE